MEKRIPYDIFMSVKRVFQACAPLMNKRASVKTKMDKLQEEYKSYDTQIASLEAGIKAVTGFRVEELVKKVVEDTDKIDPKTGKPTRTTKYLPTDIVTYDKESRQFVVTVPDAAETYRVPEESKYDVPDNDGFGSDFDIDKERAAEPTNIEPVDSDVFDF